MADKNMEAQISVEFEEATSRQSLNSGETINTLWSKVKRWLSDLKAVAFSGSYNDLSDKPMIPNVDSELSETSENPVQNKVITNVLSDKADITVLNSHINDSVKHITSTERTNWNDAKTHADSAHAPSNAQANVIETVKVNGTALIPTDKTVNITVPSNTDRYVNKAEFVDDSTTTAASPVKMTLTRAGSDTNTITANIPKVSSSSAGVVPKGSTVSSQSKTTKFLREDGTWAVPSYTTNTDTKVTAVGNHYTPAKSTTKSASGGTLTDITNSTSGTQVVTGVEMDAKGHVTGVTSVALKSTDTQVTVDSAMSDTSTNPVQNKVINSALTAIGKTVTDKTNEMFKALIVIAPAYVNPTPSNVNATVHTIDYDYGMARGDGTEEMFPTICDTYIEYDLADTSNGGLMSADHYSFIEKYKKIRGSSATYTFTSLQSYITVGNCNGDCTNGLVVLSGWFTSTGSANNPVIISGSFPSTDGSFVCGIIVNIDSPNTNTRLLIRHESDGTSSLQCGGSITAGKYFFIGVYTAERCAYNLPYTL